jgi:hypothetical protein
MGCRTLNRFLHPIAYSKGGIMSEIQKPDHSFTLGFHAHKDTPVRIRKIGDPNPFFVMEIGEYPARITIHLTREVAENIRFAAEEYLIVSEK